MKVYKGFHMSNYMTESIVVGVSNRHVHLSQEHVEALFGQGYQLQVKRMLRQSGQFAAEEKVTIVGNEEIVARVVGPVRAETQVEILTEDKEKLGINPPTRISGSLEETPGITLKGPNGEVKLERGVIIAAKHVHMSVDEVAHFDLEGIKFIDLETESKQVFERVPLRVGNKHLSEFHLDRDEAEDLVVKSGQKVSIKKRHKE